MLAASVPGRIAIPVGLASHHLTAAQAAAASQAVVLEQLREKLETGEPPEKKVALTAEEQQRLVQHALQHNLLAVASQFPMNVKISNRGKEMQHLSLGHAFPWHPRWEEYGCPEGLGPILPVSDRFLFLFRSTLILVFPFPR